jgi:hypothetical protein
VSGKYETDDNNSFPMYLSSLFFFFWINKVYLNRFNQSSL